MNTSIDDSAYEELRFVREKLEKEANGLALATTRFQILSLAGLLVLCLLLANESFEPPKWQRAVESLQQLVTRHELAAAIGKVGYQHIENYTLRQEERTLLTEVILKTGMANKISAEANMMEVSKSLSDFYYGVDFLELEVIEKSLALMEEQVGATLLRDLTRYHYEGGPLKQGTSLRDFFFSDYTLGRHRILAEKLPYEPTKSIREYVASARALLLEIKANYPEAHTAWKKLNDEWLEKYQLSDWTWGAWLRLTDQAVADWAQIVGGSIGTIGMASMPRTREKELNWISVINWLNGELQGKAKQERDAAAKATVWSITLELPLKMILLTFPLLFFAGRCVLSAFQLRHKIAAIRLTRIDGLVSRRLGEHASAIDAVRPLQLELTLVEAASTRKWRELFISYPLLFTDIAYELTSSSMAIYVLYRGINLFWWPPTLTLSTAIFTSGVFAGLALAALFWITSRDAISTVSAIMK